MGEKVLLLLFYKDGFGSKQSTKVDMWWNKETEADIFYEKYVLIIQYT